jgi:hypothetical protein
MSMPCLYSKSRALTSTPYAGKSSNMNIRDDFSSNLETWQCSAADLPEVCHVELNYKSLSEYGICSTCQIGNSMG